MRAGWEVKQLAEVAEIQGRIGWKGLTAKEYTAEGPYFLSVHSLNYGDLVDYRDAYHISQERYDESPEIMLQANDVLICKDGAGIGKVGIVGELPGQTTINSSLLLLRAKSEIVPKYLYFILQSPYFQTIVQSRLEGATTPHLYQRDIATFPIHLPPLAEQRKIVAILDSAFAGIATATANADKNLANARELYDAWSARLFGADFEKAQKRCSLKSLTSKIGSGATPRGGKSSYKSSGIPLVRSMNVHDRRFTSEGLAFIDQSQADKLSNVELMLGDVLLNITGASVARCCRLPDEYAGGRVNQHVAIIRPIEDKLLPEFLELVLTSNAEKQKLLAIGNKAGATRQAITKADIERYEVPVLDIEQQLSIVKQAQEFGRKIGLLEQSYLARKSATIALRASILAKAFSGELTSVEQAVAA